jgi:hypothetical protein
MSVFLLVITISIVPSENDHFLISRTVERLTNKFLENWRVIYRACLELR